LRHPGSLVARERQDDEKEEEHKGDNINQEAHDVEGHHYICFDGHQRFGGHWKSGDILVVIEDSKVCFPSGRTLDIIITGDRECNLIMNDATHAGTLGEDGQTIVWSDGDKWHRVSASRQLGSRFQGEWKSGDIQVRIEGASVYFPSRRALYIEGDGESMCRIFIDGREHRGELINHDTIEWNDGDRWHRALATMDARSSAPALEKQNQRYDTKSVAVPLEKPSQRGSTDAQPSASPVQKLSQRGRDVFTESARTCQRFHIGSPSPSPMQRPSQRGNIDSKTFVASLGKPSVPVSKPSASPLLKSNTRLNADSKSPAPGERQLHQHIKMDVKAPVSNVEKLNQRFNVGAKAPAPIVDKLNQHRPGFRSVPYPKGSVAIPLHRPASTVAPPGHVVMSSPPPLSRSPPAITRQAL